MLYLESYTVLCTSTGGRWGWVGAVGRVLTEVLYREALHRGPTPYPFIYDLSQKGIPFI